MKIRRGSEVRLLNIMKIHGLHSPAMEKHLQLYRANHVEFLWFNQGEVNSSQLLSPPQTVVNTASNITWRFCTNLLERWWKNTMVDK